VTKRSHRKAAPAPQAQIVQQLRELGVRPAGVLLVHCAFSQVGPVAAGPAGLIAALDAALAPAGTLVMPSMADDDDHPFNSVRTPCRAMGVVADTFWRLPGVLRSDSPHAFAARGPAAARILAPHPLDVPHGPNSPPGRVFELGGQVLLLGVGHEANTTVHVAENMAGVRYRRRYSVTVLRDGRPERFVYDEVDHCCERFRLVDSWLEARGLQRRGLVGHAHARLAASRDIIATVVDHLRENETIFLHPAGVDPECDEARQSLANTGRSA
jgi:aminoglycoside N3'-acetyltransferase